MDKQLVTLVKSVASTNNHHQNNININIYSIINNIIRVISGIITSIQATNIQPSCLMSLLLLFIFENMNPPVHAPPVGLQEQKQTNKKKCKRHRLKL